MIKIAEQLRYVNWVVGLRWIRSDAVGIAQVNEEER
jgi:hypothetical protein